MEKEKQSPYQLLCANDVIQYLTKYLQGRSYNLREDGKIEVELYFPHETPWIHINSSTDYDCETAKQVLFGVVRQKIGRDFVPAKCQECWKTVVRPRTLRELFMLLSIQKRLNLDSKCGIEVREYVPALYGGYFYNHSLKEGLATYKQVRQEVTANISPDVKVLLKRGCTEYEHQCGDSLKWDIPEWQAKLEEMIDGVLIKYSKAHKQSDLVQRHVMRGWVEWAYAHGDDTYKEYTNGEQLYPKYRTYHHLAYASPDEIDVFMGLGKEGVNVI